VVLVTGEQACLLEGKPALGLEIRALWAGAMATRVIPDAHQVTVRTRLHMAPQRRRPALHDRAGGFPDMGGQRVQRLVGGKGVLEDRVPPHAWHRTMSELFFYSITPTIPAASG
jgi:hypothetical protein